MMGRPTPDRTRDRVVLFLREEGFTLAEIGTILEVTRERVRQIETRASKRPEHALENDLRKAKETLQRRRLSFGRQLAESAERVRILQRKVDELRREKNGKADSQPGRGVGADQPGEQRTP